MSKQRVGRAAGGSGVVPADGEESTVGGDPRINIATFLIGCM